MAYEKIQKQFCEYLEYDLKMLIEKRVSAFIRQLEYIKTQDNQYLIRLYSNNWNDEMLKVVFVFNSFYQLVLGPLSSSARNSTVYELGAEIPIAYGKSIVFDKSRSRQINKAVESFNKMISKAEINEYALGSSSANDIIYNLAEKLDEEE